MQDQNQGYFNHIYQIIGENLVPNPLKLFETLNVYLFIDKPLKIIWIWAGIESRLFHRYIAANLAGKLIEEKEFNQFKYEVIKEHREPKAFYDIIQEIRSGANYEYPGESREDRDVKIDERNIR